MSDLQERGAAVATSKGGAAASLVREFAGPWATPDYLRASTADFHFQQEMRRS